MTQLEMGAFVQEHGMGGRSSVVSIAVSFALSLAVACLFRLMMFAEGVKGFLVGIACDSEWSAHFFAHQCWGLVCSHVRVLLV